MRNVGAPTCAAPTSWPRRGPRRSAALSHAPALRPRRRTGAASRTDLPPLERCGGGTGSSARGQPHCGAQRKMPRNAAKSGRPAAPESAVSPLLLREALRSRRGPPCPGWDGAAAVCAARGGARRAAVLQTAAQEAIPKRSWRSNVARGPKRCPCPNLDELPSGSTNKSILSLCFQCPRMRGKCCGN